jgi:hypothetical protein
MDRVRQRLATEMPQMTAYFQSGGLVDVGRIWDYRRRSIFK